MPEALRDIDPHMVALGVWRALHGDVLQKLALLSRADAAAFQESPSRAEHSAVYRIVRILTEYAQDEPLPNAATLDTLLEHLVPLYRAPRSLDVIYGEPAEPTDALGVVLAAVHARKRLGAGEPLSCVDVAVLIGRDRDRVTMLAASGEIPGAYRDGSISRQPWRFKVTTDLMEWIDERT